MFIKKDVQKSSKNFKPTCSKPDGIVVKCTAATFFPSESGSKQPKQSQKSMKKLALTVLLQVLFNLLHFLLLSGFLHVCTVDFVTEFSSRLYFIWLSVA